MEETHFEINNITEGGHSQDGRRIIFTVVAPDNKEKLAFSFPHEALAEIVENLLVWGELARQARKEPDDTEFKKYGSQTARARDATGFTVSASKDGKRIVLSLKCGPVINRETALMPEDAKTIGESLVAAHKQWCALFRDWPGKPN